MILSGRLVLSAAAGHGYLRRAIVSQALKSRVAMAYEGVDTARVAVARGMRRYYDRYLQIASWDERRTSWSTSMIIPMDESRSSFGRGERDRRAIMVSLLSWALRFRSPNPRDDEHLR